MPRTIAITGSSGLIGKALAGHLAARGDLVVALVRRPPRTSAEREWDPSNERLDPAELRDVNTVVNLAGAGVGDHRWTTEHRSAILGSRVSGTRTLATAILASGRPIALVNGSAVGFYGDRGDDILTEESGPGLGFLAEVTHVTVVLPAAASPAGASPAPIAFIMHLPYSSATLPASLICDSVALASPGRSGLGSNFGPSSPWRTRWRR